MFEEWYLNDLITEKIKATWKYTDHYLLKLIYEIMENSGIIGYLDSKTTIELIIEKQNYSPNTFKAIKWMLDRLALDGYVKNEDGYYVLTDKKMTIKTEEIMNFVDKNVPEGKTAFRMLETMAGSYPSFLKGEKSGVEIIFSPDNIDMTGNYYRYDLYYNVHNICGAKILNDDLEKRKNPNILEIGGGLGGGTIQFLKQRIENKSGMDFNYIFTDIANKMLRTTKKEMLTISDNLTGFEFKKLDFNEDLLRQGYEENSFDVVWGVNAIHVAKDLEYTLKQIMKILKPGGVFLISETVRPEGNLMIQQEFILNTLLDYWNVKLDENYRKTSGFLSWREWKKSLESAGFQKVETVPDMATLEKQYDNCYVSVIRGMK